MSVPATQPIRRSPSRPWLPLLILGLILLVVIGVYFYNITRPRPALVTRRDIIGYVVAKGEAVAPPSASMPRTNR